ncbi:hypothetical protein FNV43_RR02260 [Rhamnella rubrinervis]|uniref:S-protein homolog n=1 Tax=Rhamnella rubrinervis TaxID=2594499 RepID=A0A8K0HRC0_9ROSA|nr:hypothetical protein FNV43_RR02260 [Rhamnella rubrinervis]
MSGFGKQALLFTIILSNIIVSLGAAAMETKDTTSDDDRLDKFVISPKKTIVRIYNKLGDGLNLTIHCKSKDDDLGVHTIAYNSYYYWKFRVNFFGRTLFFCGLNWTDAWGVFDIYKAHRDMYRCPTRCNWEAHTDSVHGLRQGDNRCPNGKRYKWSSDPSFAYMAIDK